jgi:hypothetical protein
MKQFSLIQNRINKFMFFRHILFCPLNEKFCWNLINVWFLISFHPCNQLKILLGTGK